jgi:hypothetical protein
MLAQSVEDSAHTAETNIDNDNVHVALAWLGDLVWQCRMLVKGSSQIRDYSKT